MKTCLICSSLHNRKRSKYCSNECGALVTKSPEFSEKISKGRKLFLSENPEKHPWKKNSKFLSKPCEALKQYLKDKNIKFVEEWNPIEDRYYAIDIAFPDIKLGIEVNGNQHYNADGSLKEYYQNRHDQIQNAGWKLIELHYSSCYNKTIIDSLLTIKEQPDYTEYFKLKEEKNKKYIALPKGVKQKLKSDVKWEPFKTIILNSNIDFSKFGWVNKVSEILKIKPQKVNKWMKRYLPDFYENNCFKRNTGVSQRSSKPSLNV